MPRPFRCRRIGQMPVCRSFSPDEQIEFETVRMTLDEYEALRLLDSEGLTQEQCAARMNVSRPTVAAIYESARRKVADPRRIPMPKSSFDREVCLRRGQR